MIDYKLKLRIGALRACFFLMHFLLFLLVLFVLEQKLRQIVRQAIIMTTIVSQMERRGKKKRKIINMRRAATSQNQFKYTSKRKTHILTP